MLPKFHLPSCPSASIRIARGRPNTAIREPAKAFCASRGFSKRALTRRAFFKEGVFQARLSQKGKIHLKLPIKGRRRRGPRHRKMWRHPEVLTDRTRTQPLVSPFRIHQNSPQRVCRNMTPIKAQLERNALRNQFIGIPGTPQRHRRTRCEVFGGTESPSSGETRTKFLRIPRTPRNRAVRHAPRRGLPILIKGCHIQYIVAHPVHVHRH